MPKPPKPPTVHVQDQQFKTRALCGQPWTETTKGGRGAGDAPPPIVVTESGSVHPANCVTCIKVFRRNLGLGTGGTGSNL